MSEIIDQDLFLESEDGNGFTQETETPIEGPTSCETDDNQGGGGDSVVESLDENEGRVDDGGCSDNYGLQGEEEGEPMEEREQHALEDESGSSGDFTGLDVPKKDIEQLHERANEILSKHRKAIPFLGDKKHSIGTKVCPTRHGCKGATNCDYDYGSYPY